MSTIEPVSTVIQADRIERLDDESMERRPRYTEGRLVIPRGKRWVVLSTHTHEMELGLARLDGQSIAGLSLQMNRRLWKVLGDLEQILRIDRDLAGALHPSHVVRDKRNHGVCRSQSERVAFCAQQHVSQRHVGRATLNNALNTAESANQFFSVDDEVHSGSDVWLSMDRDQREDLWISSRSIGPVNMWESVKSLIFSLSYGIGFYGFRWDNDGIRAEKMSGKFWPLRTPQGLHNQSTVCPLIIHRP